MPYSWKKGYSLPSRLSGLWKREIVWQSMDGQETEYEKLSFKNAWALYGPSSYHWWWVRRWGKLDCGCIRNPITRRHVLYLWRCSNNCSGFDLDREEAD